MPDLYPGFLPPTLLLAGAALAGALLGLLFFGGLWWTVQRAAVSPRPAWWFGPSVVLRTGAVLFGFYLLADGSWQRQLACLSGFVLARVVLVRLSGRRSGSGAAKGGARAS